MSAHMSRLARASAARINKLWIQKKAHSQIKTSSLTGKVSTGFKMRRCAYAISNKISCAGSYINITIFVLNPYRIDKLLTTVNELFSLSNRWRNIFNVVNGLNHRRM